MREKIENLIFYWESVIFKVKNTVLRIFIYVQIRFKFAVKILHFLVIMTPSEQIWIPFLLRKRSTSPGFALSLWKVWRSDMSDEKYTLQILVMSECKLYFQPSNLGNYTMLKEHYLSLNILPIHTITKRIPTPACWYKLSILKALYWVAGQLNSHLISHLNP